MSKSQSLLSSTSTVERSIPRGQHDLFVCLEAVSSKEFNVGGTNLRVRYGLHDTPFGQALIATTPRGICDLQFLDAAVSTPVPILQRWSNAEVIEDERATQPVCEQIFDASTVYDRKPLKLLVTGTDFQIQVWRALLSLSLGETTTYQNVAEGIGRPTAARAVGTAIGRNPIAYLIPCHRVICSSGELGGYRWGLARKTAMLDWETRQISDTA